MEEEVTETNMTNPTNSLNEILKFPISIITLITSLIVLITVYIKFGEQAKKIENLHIPKPLEGIWDFRVEFSKYMGEDYQKNPDERKKMEGKAAFIWSSNPNLSGYQVLIAAKMFKANDTDKKAIVTVFSINDLFTGKSGAAYDQFKMEGTYLGRTSKNEEYPLVTDTHYTYDELKPKTNADGNITKIEFDFTIPNCKNQKSEANSNNQKTIYDCENPNSEGVITFLRK